MFEFFVENEADAAAPLVQAAMVHSAASPSVEWLIFGWLGEGRKVEICPGSDEQGRGICICFFENGKNLGHAWLSPAFVAKEYHHIAPVSDAMREGYESGFDGVDEAWFDARDKKHKRTFDEFLCETVIESNSAIEWAISYAKSDIGVAYISYPDENDWELWSEGDEETTERYRQAFLVRFSYHFQEDIEKVKEQGRSMGRGWGETYWVLEEKSQSYEQSASLM